MTRFALLTTPLLLIALASCSPPDKRGPYPAGADPVLNANYPRVVVQEGLGPYIVAGEPIVERTQLGSMRVAVPVRAATQRENLNVQYRFDFLGQDGIPLQPQQSWRFIQLPSKSQRVLEATSLDDRAADWRLEIRPGH